ncbi:MAG: YqhA family protein [Methanolinea sp.]
MAGEGGKVSASPAGDEGTHPGGGGRGTHFVGRASRIIFLLAVVGSGLLSIALFVYGFVITLSSISYAVSHFSIDISAMKEAMAIAVEIVDLFLVATVFYIISLGLFELFVAKAPLPGWLKISNVDELKEKLLGLVVIALAVLFLGESLVWPASPGDLLAYGIANAAVIGAISLYFMTKH